MQDKRGGRVVAGRYRLLDLLGRGAMGEVWRARHCALGVDVAIKFLSAPRGEAATLARERFRFEAQVAAQLGRKTQGIVAVRDVGEDAEEGPFLVMEYVRGRTLRQELDERGQMGPRQLLPWLEDIAEALAVAHGLGIVHRDIKPSNVLLAEQPGARTRAKIADFGIAKGLSPELSVDLPRQTGAELMVGTPAYMSPELFWGGLVDPGADVWALAVVAHEALTGRKPFPGRNVGEVLASIVAGPQVLPSTYCPSLPPAVDAWFARAFNLDPANRFATVQEMLTAYRAAIGPVTPPERRARPAAWTRRALAVGGVVAAMAVVLPLAGLLGGGSGAPAALQPVRAAGVGLAVPASLHAAGERPRAPGPREGSGAADVPIASAIDRSAGELPASAQSADAGRPAESSGAPSAPPPATSGSERSTSRGPRRGDWKSEIF